MGKNEVLFVLANLYKLASNRAASGGTQGTVRLTQCIRALAVASGTGTALVQDASQSAAAQLTNQEWNSHHGRDHLAKVLELSTVNSEWALGSAGAEDVEEKTVAPDASLIFRQLRERKGTGNIADVIDEDD